MRRSSSAPIRVADGTGSRAARRPRLEVRASAARRHLQAALLTVGLAWGGCAHHEPEPPDYWPTEAWQSASPESQGVSSARLADALDWVADHQAAIHSLTVVRHGRLVLDACFNGYTAGTPHELGAITQSVLGTLTGVALAQGQLKSLDQKVLDFFPEQGAERADARRGQLSLRDLLTQQSGISWVTQPTEVSLSDMTQTVDWVQFMLSQPMDDEPGRTFVDNGGAAHLLSALLTRATGVSAADYAQDRLFTPMGIRPGPWPLGPQKRYNHGWGGLHLTPHDLARLGLLYLQHGRWADRQLVPDAWIEAATGRQVQLKGDSGFGYLWWIEDEPKGMFTARGRGGQRLMVWPDKQAIVVITGGGLDPAPLVPLLVAAFGSDTPLPENPDGSALLARARQRAVAGATPNRLPEALAPATARGVSGRCFELADNPFTLQELTLTFRDPTEAMLLLKSAHYAEENRLVRFIIGLDGVPRTAPGRFQLPAAAVGQWTSDNTFEADIDEIANINRFHLRLVFGPGSVRGTLSEQTGLGSIELSGTAKD
jgi:CubicO group peptidase (beta-lactamase class C family)